MNIELVKKSMNKTICYIFAMFEEAEATIINNNFVLIEKEPFLVYKNNKSYLTITGIGLINSATCLSCLISKYDIDYFINIGTACSIDKEINVLDVVVIDNAYLGNVDVTGFGYKIGQVPKMPEKYKSSSFIEAYNISKKQANIFSSDIFINSTEKVEKYVYEVNDSIKIIDMECAALFQTSFILKKNISSIKIISDVIGSKSNEEEFSIFLKKCSYKINEIIRKIEQNKK
ncbi:5'-methylthioadenosine/S-adenosylhomocysteine nucleosidase [Spiroplasma litorale]|uniref:adenosylhomocysteine nucleosidase n=1 Tax=Spiroplasma litorale TaxID=216942 RepID=A0A0K1W0V6_9MOLU|nr:5'-methylthioadenosine/S-adenosylhomocysteine nucleosidase [Spiroplasma litorale]AKX33960.1 5'-methylthioadenosine/S-adenosylhomocysteine nucleosidase [Spiroplasma litorale]